MRFGLVIRQSECTNGCANSRNPKACQNFCDCIHNQGRPLDKCLDEYEGKKKKRANKLLLSFQDNLFTIFLTNFDALTNDSRDASSVLILQHEKFVYHSFKPTLIQS